MLRSGGNKNAGSIVRQAVKLFDIEDRAFTHRPGQRAVLEVLGLVPFGRSLRQVEVTDQLGRRQVLVPGDLDERHPHLLDDALEDCGLGGARGAFEDHVPTAEQRGQDQPGLVSAAHEVAGDEIVAIRHRLNPHLPYK